jgi:hypothetical protein
MKDNHVLGAKLVALLILNPEIVMNAKCIILQTPLIKMNKEEILLILFWPVEGPIIFNFDKTRRWKP